MEMIQNKNGSELKITLQGRLDTTAPQPEEAIAPAITGVVLDSLCSKGQSKRVSRRIGVHV